LDRCNEALGQFLRPVPTTTQPSLNNELEPLLYLNNSGNLSLASRSQRIAVRDAALRIDDDRLSDVERAHLAELREAIGSP
jgi:hypothetical protein